MRLLDLTLPTAAENLALDEALLEQAEEEGGGDSEVLRLWESPEPAVVLGRASRLAEEVDRDACRRSSVPILRRCSGGAAVMIGPGCLMYSVVLSYGVREELRLIEEAHRFVLGRVMDALRGRVAAVAHAGSSDLVIAGRKFSGNSMRCKRNHLLYHGTILYDFPLSLIGACLRTPPRQPDYRAGRSHTAFVTNLPVAADAIRTALRVGWDADPPLTDWPRELTQRLLQDRYDREEWHQAR